MRNVTLLIYGAMLAHFIQKIIQRSMMTITGVEVTFNYPMGECGYPGPVLLPNGKWQVERGLLDAMKKEGLLFDYKTGGWLKDPTYVEPETSMPF